MAFSIGLFLVLTALSAYFTARSVGRQLAGEKNIAMRLLLRIPALFWVAQGALALIVCVLMAKLGTWFVAVAISARSMTAFNDWLVYRGKLK